MASSISQGVVFTTAMLASSTMLYLAFSWQKITPLFQIHGNPYSHDSDTKMLRSCLCSEEKKRERKMTMKKKKKKVQFADNVKEAAETEEPKQRRKKNRVVPSNSYRQHEETSEIPKMPANRIALYNGILRERFHRMEICVLLD